MNKIKIFHYSAMLMPGLCFPIVFYIIGLFISRKVASDLYSIKTTVDLMVGFALLGFDKCYLLGENRKINLKYIYANLFHIILIWIFIINVYDRFDTAFGVLTGIVVGIIFAWVRAFYSKNNNNKLLIFFNVMYSVAAIFAGLTAFYQIEFYYVAIVLALLFIIFVMRKTLLFNGFENDKHVKFNYWAVIKKGSGELAISIATGVLPYLMVQSLSKKGGQDLIYGYGLLNMLSTLMRYPIQSLLPQILLVNSDAKLKLVANFIKSKLWVAILSMFLFYIVFRKYAEYMLSFLVALLMSVNYYRLISLFKCGVERGLWVSAITSSFFALLTSLWVYEIGIDNFYHLILLVILNEIVKYMMVNYLKSND